MVMYDELKEFWDIKLEPKYSKESVKKCYVFKDDSDAYDFFKYTHGKCNRAVLVKAVSIKNVMYWLVFVDASEKNIRMLDRCARELGSFKPRYTFRFETEYFWAGTETLSPPGILIGDRVRLAYIDYTLDKKLSLKPERDVEDLKLTLVEKRDDIEVYYLRYMGEKIKPKDVYAEVHVKKDKENRIIGMVIYKEIDRFEICSPAWNVACYILNKEPDIEDIKQFYREIYSEERYERYCKETLEYLREQRAWFTFEPADGIIFTWIPYKLREKVRTIDELERILKREILSIIP